MAARANCITNTPPVNRQTESEVGVEPPVVDTRRVAKFCKEWDAAAANEPAPPKITPRPKRIEDAVREPRRQSAASDLLETTQGCADEMRLLVGTEDQDAFDVLMRYRSGHFMRVKDGGGVKVYVRLPTDLWTQFSHKSPASCGVVKMLLEDARRELLESPTAGFLEPEDIEDAKAKLSVSNSEMVKLAHFTAALVGAMHPSTNRMRMVASSALNRRETRPVVPLTDGGAWCIRTDSRIEGDELADLLLTDCGWCVEAPDYSALKATTPGAMYAAQACGAGGRFEPMMERAACYLTGCAKAVDTVTAPPDRGKSTFYESMKLAMPGAFAVEDADEYLNPTSQFKPLNRDLAHCLCVAVDEACKQKPKSGSDYAIGAQKFNQLTASDISVHLKGVDPYTLPRQGTVVLVANNPPSIEPAAGVKQRRRWAYRMSGGKSMTGAERRLLRTTDALAWMRAKLFETAHSLAAGGGAWQVDAARQADADVVVKGAMTPEAQALAAAFVEDRNAKVKASDVNDVLAEVLGEDDVPKGRTLGRLVKSVFPNAKSATGRVGGELSRCWHGIEAKP